MIQLTVGEPWSGKRLDRFLLAMCPDVSSGIIRKAFRKKDVKVNGRRSSEETRLIAGDTVMVYLVHAPKENGCCEDVPGSTTGIVPPAPPPANRQTMQETPCILFEDDHLLIVFKPQGIAVQKTRMATGQAGGGRATIPFDMWIRAWWAKNRQALAPGFPVLCHRLDRNTGGLLMLAKSEPARRQVEESLRAHRIRKFYRCFVYGIPNPPAATIDAWLEKDAQAGRVYIHGTSRPNAHPIRTCYRTVASGEGISLLEVEIVTGRTHQIRAQLAWCGLPILGDSRYGSNAVNRRHHVRRQLLWACRLAFDAEERGYLSSLAGKTIACGIPEDALPQEALLLLAQDGDPHGLPNPK